MEVKCSTYADLYNELVLKLLGYPEYVDSPRGQKTHEITNITMKLTNPKSNMFKNAARDIPKKYLAAELLWYFSGRNDLDFIGKYASFWKNIVNADDTLNSAYGNLIFNKRDSGNMESQWKWAYDSLVNDKDSRQALLHFNRPEHQFEGNKDFVCTLNGVFLIRDNKLHFSTIMRSNDVYFGLTFDLPFFTLLQQQMHRHLVSVYPGLELGTYTQFDISLHAYERNFEKLSKMIENKFEEDNTPELDIDLINPDGTLTEDLASLIVAVEEGQDFQSDSKFLSWIFSNLS